MPSLIRCRSGLEEVEGARQLGHRGRLAAGDDEPVARRPARRCGVRRSRATPRPASTRRCSRTSPWSAKTPMVAVTSADPRGAGTYDRPHAPCPYAAAGRRGPRRPACSPARRRAPAAAAPPRRRRRPRRATQPSARRRRLADGLARPAMGLPQDGSGPARPTRPSGWTAPATPSSARDGSSATGTGASARTTPREVFSVTKSVTSALVGIAVRDGVARRSTTGSSRYVPAVARHRLPDRDGPQPALRRQRPLLVARLGLRRC